MVIKINGHNTFSYSRFIGSEKIIFIISDAIIPNCIANLECELIDKIKKGESNTGSVSDPDKIISLKSK